MTHAIQLLLMSAGVIAWHEAECAVQQDSIMRSAFALHTCAALLSDWPILW